MHIIRRGIPLLLCSISALLAACEGGSGPSAPAPPLPPAAPRAVIEPVSSTQLSAGPGEYVSPAPSIRVFDPSRGGAVTGITVRFSVVSGGGAIAWSVATTDERGMASVGSWRLGGHAGVNQLLASADGVGSVTFNANASTPPTVATYDLQTVRGQRLPISYYGDGSLVVNEGHYVFYNDGTCTFGYEFAGGATAGSSASMLTYVRTGPATISIYLLPGTYPMSSFYQERGGLFATGTLTDSTMTVKYEDFIDFEDEVYALASGAIP